MSEHVTSTPQGTAPESWAAVNGRLVPEAEAVVSCLDRGFLYGDGLFETMKARQGRVDFLHRHMERLERSARALCIPFPSPEILPELIRELLARNQIHETASVKLCLSRGRHTGALTLYEPQDPTQVLIARNWEEPDLYRWEQGLSLTVENELRLNSRSGICGLKSMNYLANLLARTRAERDGFEDALLLNERDEVCECTTSNLFWFRDGRLETPERSCGLLPGVVRAVLMDVQEQAGNPVFETRSNPDRLRDADEVFVTNSLLEILPVGRIQETTFLRRSQTRALFEHFRDYRDSLNPPGPGS